MNNEHEGGSMYDFAGENYQAPAEMDLPVKNTPAPVKPVETPHANRPHGVLKYENNLQFQKKADAAPTESAPKTSADTEWWRFFTGQTTNNHVAMAINGRFNNKIIPNYDEEKARYIREYNKELIK